MNKISFLEHNIFIIKEEVNIFAFANNYTIYNADGDVIGSVKQKMTLGDKFLKFLLGNSAPFLFEIRDTSGRLWATISRGWLFMLSKMTLCDAEGNHLIYIDQKFKFFNSEFEVLNAHGGRWATIVGDWAAWDFEIRSEEGASFGFIRKKWAGMLREMFTTADKYMVQPTELANSPDKKLLVLATAIAVDMVFKEKKKQ